MLPDRAVTRCDASAERLRRDAAFLCYITYYVGEVIEGLCESGSATEEMFELDFKYSVSHTYPLESIFVIQCSKNTFVMKTLLVFNKNISQRRLVKKV